ncbi:biofilm surface layer hydrophobin BslB [Bacillus sp. z60-18]|uniref:biofilm surface layer hydrophobin BslB n=1 Tax=unclassified Bacillus (in: firmicutes) TaxID=185979 RepID=UPI00390C7342
MFKRKFIGKLCVGLLSSAALFSFILPAQKANASFFRSAPTLHVETVDSNKEWTTSDIEVTYRPNSFVGASYVEFNFPYRFHANTRDSLNGRTLSYTQILNDGQTVRVPVYAFSSSQFKLVMVRKTLPNAGTHTITAEMQKFGRNYHHAETTVEIFPR